MSIECFYAPTKNALRLTIAQVAERFTAAGLSCQIAPEVDGMFWLSFEGHESDVLASVEEGAFTFGTFNFNGDDPLSVPEIVEQVMQSIGFSADEDAEY